MSDELEMRWGTADDPNASNDSLFLTFAVTRGDTILSMGGVGIEESELVRDTEQMLENVVSGLIGLLTETEVIEAGPYRCEVHREGEAGD